MDRLWRIGGYSGEVEGCEGVVWISEGMDRGAEVDGRADVSFAWSGQLSGVTRANVVVG